MVSSKAFFEEAIKYIDQAADAERNSIYQAAQMMGDCMNNNGVVQLFGLDHGKAFSMELGYRAGGLMPFHKCDVQDLALRGVISEAELKDPGFNHDPEMAHKLYDIYRIEKEVAVVQEGSTQDDVLLYAPFLCGNWWIVLGVALAIILVTIFIYADKKNMLNKKQKITIGICLLCILVIGGAMLFLKNYERRFVWSDVALYMVIDEEETGQMQIYDVSGYTWADREVKLPDKDAETIELSSAQKEMIVEITNKIVRPVRHLWYRYDAVIVVDEKVEYMISTKEQVVYVNYVDENEEFLGYIELSREENQMLREIIEKR